MKCLKEILRHCQFSFSLQRSVQCAWSKIFLKAILKRLVNCSLWHPPQCYWVLIAFIIKRLSQGRKFHPNPVVKLETYRRNNKCFLFLLSSCLKRFYYETSKKKFILFYFYRFSRFWKKFTEMNKCGKIK